MYICIAYLCILVSPPNIYLHFLLFTWAMCLKEMKVEYIKSPNIKNYKNNSRLIKRKNHF